MTLIAFEGAEATGKSTQVKLLGDALTELGYKVFITREPGGTELGDEIRKLLTTCYIDDPLIELLLISAGRRSHVQLIKQKISDGYIVITDRFIDSSKAYQGYTKGLSLNVVNTLIDLSIEGVVPNLVFVLNLDIKVLMLRLQQSKTHNSFYDKQSEDFHKQISRAFEQIAETQETLKAADSNDQENRGKIHSQKKTHYYLIDGDRDRSEIHTGILATCVDYLQNAS